jgi:CheY-like chemotaxis protein
MRVLIACSDASVRNAFLDVLRRAGIGVIAVADAAAALELARQQRPDVVLVDDECRGSAASQACRGWPPRARIRSSWSSPHGSIEEVACARSWRAPPGTSAGESRPRPFRALFAV